MYAYFDRFQIRLTLAQAKQGSHPGDVTADIQDLLTVPAIAKQLDAIPAHDIALELEEYGAWDESELSDDDRNRERILWIACGNIVDE